MQNPAQQGQGASPHLSSRAPVPRVLIVSTGRDRGALAAARAFKSAGWYVGVGTPDGGGVLGSSRACDITYRVPRPRDDGMPFVEGVRRAAADGGFDIVFGGGDDWMAALAAYRSQIPMPVAHPDYGVVQTILDKVKLAEHARKAGLASPHTELATDDSLAAWAGPVVIKCKEHWSPNQTRPLRIEAKLFPDAVTALPQVKRITAAGAEPILQKPISGHLGALIGVFHDGRLHGRTQQVSTRLWPTPNGASARARTVLVDEELAKKAETLLTNLNWHGLVELQFLTGDDGIPHLIDFNGRFYGSLALAEHARPGLVDAWANIVLLSKSTHLDDASVGARYSWAAGDFRRARIERRGGLIRDVIDSMRWSAQARHSVWDRHDIRPSIVLALSRFR